MSLKTWCREFYRKEASATKRSEAVAHSLRKWEGLKAANLRKHGMKQEYDRIVEKSSGDWLGITDTSCALCVHFFKYVPTGSLCQACPLFIARGGVACTDTMEAGTIDPYTDFVGSGRAGPMLKWLRKAAKKEQAK